MATPNILRMKSWPAVHNPETLAALEKICKKGPQSMQDLFIFRNHWDGAAPFLKQKPK